MAKFQCIECHKPVKRRGSRCKSCDRRYNMSFEERMAELEHYPYPDDLPIPRQMQYGPHTPDVARRYLDSDYPLPGTFPDPEMRDTEMPAWIDYLDKGIIYPGSKLSKDAKAARDLLVHDFANSKYSDASIAREIFDIDRRTGYNPIFEFQYAVLNFKKWSSILIFELNGVNHILHWHDRTGWHIDKQPISENPEESKDNLTLFDLIANSLNPEQVYPVIAIKKRFHGAPARILQGLPSGPPDKAALSRFGVRKNPSNLQSKLEILEEEFFDQPPFLRKRDLVKINKLREQLELPPVDSNLNPIIEKDEEEAEQAERVKAKPKKDPFIETRRVYNQYIEKRNMMQPHRDYCQKMIKALRTVNGRTPVMPLATMGTDGGPVLCDICEKQFPLEGGRFNRMGAGEAWNQHPNPNAQWYSFIYGHITVLEESNGTFRAYHGHMNSGCGGVASKQDKENRENFTPPERPFKLRQKLDAFLKEEKGIDNFEERRRIIFDLNTELYGYDPGIGVNRPG